MKKTALSLSIGGLLAMAAGIGIGRFVYTAILPPMIEALHLSKSQAGLIASANFVGYLAGALLATLKLPGSRRSWLLAALAANAIGLAAMGLTASLVLFLVLRLLAGIFSAFSLVFASALVIHRLNEAGRPQLSAVHFAGVGTGIAASAAVVATLGDWRAMWFASAALAVIAAFAVALLVPEDDHPSNRPAAHGNAPIALVAAYGLFGFGYVITATFIVAQVRSAPAIAPLEPYVWILFGLSAAPSVALWTALARRWNILNAYAAAAVIEAIGVAGSAIWTSEATIIGAALLVGGTFMGLTALGLIAAAGRIALMTASFGLGQILGPLFAGYVFDATGSLSLPLLGAAAALIVAAMLALFVPKNG
ncbi:MAG TPA: YbfB/YjiJ family MFS transporter [Reyranella sp.]|jgi:predicted MFS family arabinose efflux permease|nr:YbfB/YjiJ family MFS transporter [Reyranella sp.]